MSYDENRISDLIDGGINQQNELFSKLDEDNFNLLYERIEKAFKEGTVYLCPKCSEITKIITNPFYYWKCEHCEHVANYMSLPMKTTKDFVRENIIEFYKQKLIN